MSNFELQEGVLILADSLKVATGRGLEISREIERNEAAIAAHQKDIIKAKQLGGTCGRSW